LLEKGPFVNGESQARYPDRYPDGLRVACDLMAFMFVFDEYTDKLDSDSTRVHANMVMDALRNPHVKRPQGESKLGEIARQCAPILKCFTSMAHGAIVIGFHYVPFELQADRLSDVSSQHSRNTCMQ
jgi:hypothetical protein